MEIVGNNINGTTYRCWKIILEVEKFISENDKKYFETRRQWYKNYYRQLMRLIDKNQLLIERDGDNNIIGICGWARIKKSDEWKINKIRWSLPDNITDGDILYISFCVLKGGHVHNIRRELKRRYDHEVNETFWFSIANNRYVRLKNVLKEK